MERLSKYVFLILFSVFFITCSSDDDNERDETKPEITVNYDGGFPQSCAQLKRGETYNFRAMVTDNRELAAYSLDIHHNFDHHTHDDQDKDCKRDSKKEAVNPMIFMENYSIEEGLTTYEINIEITIPDDVDTGDYHCAYSVTDKTGWQGRTSIDIKIIE